MSRLRVVPFAGWRKTTNALSSESNELAFLFSVIVRSVAGSLKERIPSGGIKPARGEIVSQSAATRLSTSRANAPLACRR